MDIGENIEVEEKIRRALQTPSFDDEQAVELKAAVEKPTAEINSNKKKKPFISLLKIAVIATIFSLVYLGRTDSNANIILSGTILKIENKLGFNLSLIKSLVGVSINLSANEFANAVKQNNTPLAIFLLDWGLAPESINSEGDTLLITAIRAGNLELVSVLLNRGSKVTLPNAKGQFPIEFAIANPEMIITLVKAGANVNNRDLTQQTLLMKAATLDNIEVLKALISVGADPDLQDSTGKTALHLAIDGSKFANIEYLKSIGANQNIQDRAGVKVADLLKPKQEEAQKNENSWWDKSKQAAQTAPVLSTAPKMTAVRALGKVQGVWENSSQLTLKKVIVEVRNVGDETANGVNVKVKLPGGKEVSLTGPASLEPYATAKFSADPEEAITRNGDLKSIVSCENCHK